MHLFIERCLFIYNLHRLSRNKIISIPVDSKFFNFTRKCGIFLHNSATDRRDGANGGNHFALLFEHNVLLFLELL